MIMCSRCNTENEEDQSYCERCGNLLEDKKLSEEVDEPGKKNVQMCPRCKVVYEKEEYCVKCKSKLVPKVSPLEGSEERDAGLLNKKEDRTEFKSLNQNREVQVLLTEKEDPKTKSGLEMKQNNAQFVVLPRPAKRLPEDRISLFYGWGQRKHRVMPVLLLIAGIVLLIGTFSYLWVKESEPPAPLVRAPVVIPDPRSLSEGEGEETQRITALLENIRQANLQKNIDLFMSCYAPGFKNREDKRHVTLENWKTFDFLDLSYKLKNQVVSGNTAMIQVEWLIKTSGDKSRLNQNRIVIDASLEKEDEAWRIREIKTSG